jgi:predicted lipoprotein with Yx(FWY)xxD motif
MMRNKYWVPAGLAAVALAAAACGNSPAASTVGAGESSASAVSSPGPSPSGTTLKTAKVGGVAVVTNAKGFTLYWFVPDTATKSNCNGSCATFWPPVKGPATAAAGVTGKLGTIKRSDGSTQATYNGHPLYTYAGDTAPGQAKGNGINLSGGLWHEVTVSVAAATSRSSAKPSASSSGGYGY